MKGWKDKEEFKARMRAWAEKIDVNVRSVAMQPMKKKWASCSTAGNFRFNSERLDLDKGIGDYVMVHELLHFRVPNHGKLWKSLMKAHLGDFEKTEEKLKNIING